MKHLAFLAALAMSASLAPSIASAQPTIRAHVEWNHDRYDHYDNSHWRHDVRRWVPLAQGYSAATDRQFIPVLGRGEYRRIRIEGTRGQPVVLKVAIEFTDKSVQAMDLNETLPRGAGTVIDLNGDQRRINRIIVYTDARARGSYSIYGT